MNEQDIKKDWGSVRKSIPRHESSSKVTGQAAYTDDLAIPGIVFGRILRSPYAHARVLRIDKAKAEKVPGVLAILLPLSHHSDVGLPAWSRACQAYAADR